jgi:hypothetical protein
MILAKAPDPINVIGFGMGGPLVMSQGTEDQKTTFEQKPAEAARITEPKRLSRAERHSV